MTQKRYGESIVRAMSGHGPLSVENIVVLSYQREPDLFALGCYPVPDARKVQSTLYGRRGLNARGLVERHGDLWKLTEAGERVARDGWPRADQSLPGIVAQGLRCRAMRLFRAGRIEEVEWVDVLDLWGKFDPNDFGAQLRRLDQERGEVREVARLHDLLYERFRLMRAIEGRKRA